MAVGVSSISISKAMAEWQGLVRCGWFVVRSWFVVRRSWFLGFRTCVGFLALPSSLLHAGLGLTSINERQTRTHDHDPSTKNKEQRTKNDEGRRTNHEPRTTNHEPRTTNHERFCDDARDVSPYNHRHVNHAAEVCLRLDDCPGRSARHNAVSCRPTQGKYGW